MSVNVRFIPRKEVLGQLVERYPEFKPEHLESIQALFMLSSDLEKSLDAYFQIHHGFSRARFLFLLVLLHAEQHRLTAMEMAKSLQVTKGNITGLLEGLRADHLVRKFDDPEDGRRVWIEITEEGKKRVRGIFPDYFKRISKLMNGLSGADLAHFVRVARQLQKGVEAFRD